MNKLCKIAYFLAGLTLFSACSSTPEPVDKQSASQSKIQIEPQKGRLTLENSLARSLKYNTEPLKQQIMPKVLGEDARKNAFANLNKLREDKKAELAISLKELDFAILYTALNSSSDNLQIDTVLTQTTAQNLSLATIKAHKNALFSHKQIFEIRRKIRQHQSQIATIIKKSSPSDDDLEIKKVLEDNIDNLNAMLKQLEQNLEDFRQLVKLDSTKFEIDGRRFFDSIDLQPQIKPLDYQILAFSARQELKALSPLDIEYIAKKIDDQYTNNASQIDGFYVQNSAYQQNLMAHGDAQASVLLQITLDYQKASRTKKEKIRPKLEEELYKSIYLQVALAYELANKISVDYQLQQDNLEQIKQNIRKLQKVSHPTHTQKIAFLQEQLNLLKNEMLSDQILAEKAITITSLRFYSGQLNISPDLLNKNLAELSSFLAQELSKKYTPQTKTLSSLNQKEKILPNETNSWAHKENWLEDLMTEKQPSLTASQVTTSSFAKKQDYDKKTVMQLGAFLDMETAQAEWQKLCAKFSDLNKYTPTYEKTEVAGIALFRLSVQSSQGGFKDICILLRQNGQECFLRD